MVKKIFGKLEENMLLEGLICRSEDKSNIRAKEKGLEV
jgi:hypothetical protein